MTCFLHICAFLPFLPPSTLCDLPHEITDGLVGQAPEALSSHWHGLSLNQGYDGCHFTPAPVTQPESSDVDEEDGRNRRQRLHFFFNDKYLLERREERDHAEV